MSTQKIDIERITDNRFQARDSYDDIEALAESIANEIRRESGQSNIALVYTRLPDAKQEQMRELAERIRQDAETEEATTPF